MREEAWDLNPLQSSRRNPGSLNKNFFGDDGLMPSRAMAAWRSRKKSGGREQELDLRKKSARPGNDAIFGKKGRRRLQGSREAYKGKG